MAGQIEVQGVTVFGYDPVTHTYWPAQVEPAKTDSVNNEGYGALILLSRSLVTNLLNASPANVTVWTSPTLDTTYMHALAIDINVTAITGGTTPTVTFNIQRRGADGTTWYTMNTPTALSAPGQINLSLGEGLSTNKTLSDACQFVLVTTGAPTGVSFTISVFGR